MGVYFESRVIGNSPRFERGRYTSESYLSNHFMKYDWKKVRAYYELSHSAMETIRYFGMARQTWYKAILAKRITTKDNRIPLEELLVQDRPVNRRNLKKRLIEVRLLKPECYICGIKTWLDKLLSLQLDHINGKKNDQRIENLRLLCPNCHSQTETFAGRNSRKKNSLVI